MGSAWTALASWVLARRAGGAFVLRMEDLDRPRVVKGSAARLIDDLRWLGLPWDEPQEKAYPLNALYTQSARTPFYDAALEQLTRQGLTYPCDCSRSEIAQIASAPHQGEETVYPGLCRDRSPHRPFRREPAIRLRLPHPCRLAVEDDVLGTIDQDLVTDVGDFVLRRGDGIYAYQLAVIVDDVAMQISHVVRGADLALSTPRQVLLARLLGGRPPQYAHIPLVVAPDGSRLAKRTRGASIASLRESGFRPEIIIGKLAQGLGLVNDDRPRSADEVVQAMQKSGGAAIRWRTTPWAIPQEWAMAGE